MERPVPTLVLQLRSRLEALREEKYRRFHSSLVPGCGNVLGVRVPLLRALAKEMSGHDGDRWEEYLQAALPLTDKYYEETALQALVLGTAKMLPVRRLGYIRALLPKISSWGTCDLFCSALREARRCPQEYWPFVLSCYRSPQPYELRFAIVMTLSCFTADAYADEALQELSRVRYSGSDEYYVKMAVAWAISVFFVKQRQKTLALLQNTANGLDAFTQNKAIQKIRESRRVSAADKALVQKLKR